MMEERDKKTKYQQSENRIDEVKEGEQTDDDSMEHSYLKLMMKKKTY